MTTYLKKCWKCRKETPHYEIKVSRLKGVKVACHKCHRQISKYIKVKNLKIWEEPSCSNSSVNSGTIPDEIIKSNEEKNE